MTGPDSKPNVLLIGDPRLGPFEPIVQILQQTVGDQALCMAADTSELSKFTSEATREPDVIVVLQAWPDQYSIADANQLISRFPFARLVCCYGPWCDSDGRNRSIWPLAVRVPAASFAARFAHELGLVAALPLTASRAEIFEFDFGCQATRFPIPMTAAIISPDRDWREMIASALAKRGVHVAPEAQADRVAVIVFDADPWHARRASELETFRHSHRKSTLIACCGFPNSDLDWVLRDVGANHIWFKLASLGGLANLMVAAAKRG